MLPARIQTQSIAASSSKASYRPLHVLELVGVFALVAEGKQRAVICTPEAIPSASRA